MRTFDKDTEQLLKQRIEQRYTQGRLKEVYSIDPETGQNRKYTPREILDEIQRGTQKGEDFLLSEKKLKDELDKRL
jgi:hypothetical protein